MNKYVVFCTVWNPWSEFNFVVEGESANDVRTRCDAAFKGCVNVEYVMLEQAISSK